MGFVSDLFSDETTQKTKPWKPAQPYLKDAMANLGGLGVPQYYGGQLIADQNQMLQGGLGNLYGYGSGFGGAMQHAMGYGGMMGVDAMGQGMDYLSQLQNGGAPQFQYDNNLYNQTMNQMAPGMQAMFDSGAQDIQRGFDWNTLPQLNMSGALSGQQGATKQYQGGVLGQAMADKNIADFGTGIWNNANQMANQNAMTSGMQNLSSAQNNISNVLAGYGNYASMANPMLSGAYGMGQDNINNQLRAGQYQQMYNQSLIDAEKGRYMYNQTSPWQYEIQRLNALNGVGSAYGTSTGTESTGLGNVALQLGGAYLMGSG